VFFCYCSLLVISIQLAEQAQEKRAKQVAAQEKAQARKDKQAKNKAKAAERERRQNQENIRKLRFSSISLSLRQHAFSS
jgi:ribosomal protein L20